MELHVGTSGFGYREWKGKFYPRGLPASRMLDYYAARLGAVEINSSFYRMPRASTLRAWASQAPAGFSYSFKAPASITHIRRLLNAQEPLRRFFAILDAVGEALGCVVFQLPPSFKKDLPRLEAFLALLPRDRRCAFEFRHPSWFSEDVLAALRGAGAALCLNDADVEGCPLAATAGFGVLKLRKTRYSGRELSERLRQVRAQPWERAYVFFKHEARAAGPRLAARWLSLDSGYNVSPRGSRVPRRRALRADLPDLGLDLARHQGRARRRAAVFGRRAALHAGGRGAGRAGRRARAAAAAGPRR